MTGGQQALAAALAGEHAAIYGYGVLGAHLTGQARTLARQVEAAHRSRRDQLLELLHRTGATPPAAAPAYMLPYPVTDPDSALQLAVEIEERTAAVWRATLPATTGDQRAIGLAGLTDAARYATRWRRMAGQTPLTVALPGS